MRAAPRLLRQSIAVRSWPLWSLQPRWLLAFVLAVIAADLAAIGVAVSSTTVTGSNLALFGLLVGCTAASVELTRKSGEQGGMIKDVAGVWELPAAILLPALYALIVPIIRIALLQLRTRRAPVYRRVFSGAMLSLSYGAASVTFHGLSGLIPQEAGGTLSRGTVWTLVIVVSVLMKEIVNKTMLMTVVKATDPGATYRTEVFRREPLYNDGAEICTGVLVTYGVAGNPWLALAALPVVTLLQRSLRHVQLVNDSRADSKTGLLNAATWEREATAEVTRAVRTRTPLAVAMVDIDRFKVINDTYGHLAGDYVLKQLASTVKQKIRREDLFARYGGEEFAIILPEIALGPALTFAEKIRQLVEEQEFRFENTAIDVTISMGVASISQQVKEIDELIKLSDEHLYAAKTAGRNRVYG